jgi:polyisoprenoid-binding protein YceI
MKMIAYFLVGIALCLSAAGSQAWVVFPEASHVDFAVHVTVDSFVGHLVKFETNFLAIGSDHPTAGTLNFQVTDLKTGKEDRDAAMQDWLEAKKFPLATFVLKKLEPVGTQFEASGDFTLHGVTRSINFPVSLGTSGQRQTIDGTVTIDHREWDLKIIRKLGLLKVDPVIKATFHFEVMSP